jgi:ribosomal protein S18 acetylase RimI-like enzyme
MVKEALSDDRDLALSFGAAEGGAGVSIYPLSWRKAGAFARLRTAIERESKHLAVGSGERKETGLYVLLRMFVNRGRMHTLVAGDEDELVGFISILFPRYRKLKGNGYMNVSVQGSHRNRGIGTRLIREAEQLAKAKGARRLELEVFAKNKKAIALYERLGYTVEGCRKDAVDDGGSFDDIIFMAKFL